MMLTYAHFSYIVQHLEHALKLCVKSMNSSPDPLSLKEDG